MRPRVGFPLFLMAQACATPVALRDAPEEAARAEKQLQQAGIAARAEALPENGLLITVPWTDARRAVTVLSRDTNADTTAEESARELIPSRQQLLRRRLRASARALQETLRALPGVVTARVHVSVPETREDARPRASVVMQQEAGAPPQPDAVVQRLVADGVDGLAPERVHVVRASAAEGPPAPRFVRLGPVSVPESSRPPLAALLSALVLLNLVTVAALALVWTRSRRDNRPRQALD